MYKDIFVGPSTYDHLLFKFLHNLRREVQSGPVIGFRNKNLEGSRTSRFNVIEQFCRAIRKREGGTELHWFILRGCRRLTFQLTDAHILNNHHLFITTTNVTTIIRFSRFAICIEIQGMLKLALVRIFETRITSIKWVTIGAYKYRFFTYSVNAATALNH
jgi:hypothetical protein